MKPRKATQKDVAKACDVSQALVSLVMSGNPVDVAETTKQRILDAAKKLGYTPKKNSGLAKRTRLLAYIRPLVTRGHHGEHWIYDSLEEYYNRVQNRLLEEAWQAGYSLIVRPYTENNELTRWLLEWGVDGVFWHADDKALAHWIAQRFPMVQIARTAVINAGAVSTNSEEMVALALNHLRKNGHRRIAYLPGKINDDLMKQRNRAYEDYMEAHGLVAMNIPLTNESTFQEAEESMFALLERPEEFRPTAFFISDHSALYFIKEAVKRGIRLPDELSIVGMDNFSVSAFSHPALTTVDTQMQEVARTAADMLCRRIKDPDLTPQKILITPKLIVRESVRNIIKHPERTTITV